MADRLAQVRRRLDDFGARGLLLSSLPNIRWACGFTGTNGLLLVTENTATFVTDGRYTEQARQEVEGAEVLIASNGLLEELLDEGCLDDLGRVVIQADDVTLEVYRQLQENASAVEWDPRSGVLTSLVGTKDESEIQRIRAAQALTEEVFSEILEGLRPGRTEREVAAEITYGHLRRGAEAMAFDPIVASGPNAARPHARPTDRALQTGDLVVLDMGATLEGYASDMSRTVAIGEPPEVAREGYGIVREAQRRALDAACSGITGKELDAIARRHIEDAGLGEYFAHGLGHGIGLEVHEWPRVSHSVEETLPAGACVTIEPGVYVPEEEYGVRIEDIVVLEPDGCRNLTQAEKALRVLGA
ncbi:MAG: aminopeptidase P family protein [Salinibacter sp.]